ncbi:MAG TPA: biotin carboxylase N-terminal domain-containing protein, partial [Nitrolancea sp.]|nr:biotin carboxylase N-terminal domain-containing protein [Nitrolancea sp.]
MSVGRATFEKVLIANRGEIALRVMRACHELGIATVAVFGEGELNAPHVRYAREAFRIPSERPLPYLDGAALIAVARQCG